MVYLQRTVAGGKVYDYWVTPEKFAARTQKARQNFRNWYNRTKEDPVRRELHNTRSRLYYYRRKLEREQAERENTQLGPFTIIPNTNPRGSEHLLTLVLAAIAAIVVVLIIVHAAMQPDRAPELRFAPQPQAIKI